MAAHDGSVHGVLIKAQNESAPASFTGERKIRSWWQLPRERDGQSAVAQRGGVASRAGLGQKLQLSLTNSWGNRGELRHNIREATARAPGSKMCRRIGETLGRFGFHISAPSSWAMN